MLVRKRERVLKTETEKRSAEMLAQFDTQCAKIYAFDDDEIWEAATTEAMKAVKDANDIIKERCRKLGIPDEFAPSMGASWNGRGQNAVASRRAELHRMAKSQIDAAQVNAKAQIERMSLDAQTAIVATGLESEAAKKFLNEMPPMESLMPLVDATQVKKLYDANQSERRNKRWFE